MSVLAVIRMKGRFSVSPKVEETLASLKLNKLYSCTIVPQNESYLGMLQKCKDVISFGEIDKETVALLLSKKGKMLEGKKISQLIKEEEIEKLAEGIIQGKKLSELNLQPFFSLSPPKGGFGERKKHVPYGPIGRNPKIADLIKRMV